ncbi:hypothetical protein ABT160_31575 [Streptomyces sp. NPDC001941]|uniref:hypothetical protein n=1 Tax=Streptomyces sp. NPDC001941 TaxID=3154659 RepID=UPI0033313559
MPEQHARGSGSGEEPVPDDVWQRFLEDSERDIRASAPKEPSARARMVTERLRQEAEQPAPWRGPTARPRRRRRWLAVVGVLLAALAALIAMKPSLVTDLVSADGPSAGPSALPPETAAPSAPPPSDDPEEPTLKEPFRGSPAERYADGAAGIELPAARAVGALSAGEVAKALARAKDFLVDANLDPETLRGGSPETALALVDPKQRGQLDGMNRALRTPTTDNDPLSYFSRFDPQVTLAGPVVKTRGRMTYAPDGKGGLTIHTDFTFVYPLVKSTPGATEVARTIVRRVIDFEALNPAKYQATPGRLALGKVSQDTGNSECGTHDGFLHPRFPSDAPTGPTPSGTPVDPYDRSKPLPTTTGSPDACGTLTRT